MRVKILCPICDDGDTQLTVAVSPDSVDDMEGDCGHAEEVWDELTSEVEQAIWRAVADEEEGRYLDAEESRYQAWRDR